MVEYGHLRHEFTEQFTEFINICYIYGELKGWLNKQLQSLPITKLSKKKRGADSSTDKKAVLKI
jgi:hypothetical protein